MIPILFGVMLFPQGYPEPRISTLLFGPWLPSYLSLNLHLHIYNGFDTNELFTKLQ